MYDLSKDLEIYYQYFSSCSKENTKTKKKQQQQSEWQSLLNDVMSDLSIQYADFGYWQQQLLQGETVAQHVQYWKQKLIYNGELVSALQLPIDHPRPVIQTFEGSASKLIEF